MGLGDLEPERSERAFRGGLLLCSLSLTLPEEPMEVQGSERSSPEPQVLRERLRSQLTWIEAAEGLEAEKSEAWVFLLSDSPAGKCFPAPGNKQQKRPCPEAHLLLLKGAPETNRMELPLRQNLGQLQSPQ